MLNHGFILDRFQRQILRRQHDAVGLGYCVVGDRIRQIDSRRVRGDLGQLGHAEEARRRVLEQHALRNDHQRIVAQDQRIGLALVLRNLNQQIPYQRGILRRIGNLALNAQRTKHRVQHRQHLRKLFLVRQFLFLDNRRNRRCFGERHRRQRHCQYQQYAQELLHCLSLLQIRLSLIYDLQYLRQPLAQKSSRADC